MSVVLTPGESYDFSLHPSTRYGATHKGMKLLGTITAALTPTYGVTAQVEHDAVYSTLPAGVVDDPSSYNWLVFQDINDAYLVVGEPWIVDGTLTVNGDTKAYTYTVVGDSNTPNRVAAALRSIGITNFTVEVKNA